MKKTSRRGHSTLNELNITPLLDLVFVLLVIFIITTPQMVNSLEMALPSGKPPPARPADPKPKINRIVVDEQGQVFLNDGTGGRGPTEGEIARSQGGGPGPENRGQRRGQCGLPEHDQSAGRAAAIGDHQNRPGDAGGRLRGDLNPNPNPNPFRARRLRLRLGLGEIR